MRVVCGSYGSLYLTIGRYLPSFREAVALERLHDIRSCEICLVYAVARCSAFGDRIILRSLADKGVTTH